MSDTERFLALLAERGGAGLHSHETRRLGVSGNPSQRAKDAASAGTPVFKARESVGHRQGVRFWLGQYAPDFAVPVRPNNVSEPAGPLSGEPARAGGADPDAPGETLFDVPDESVSAVTGQPVRRAA